MQKMQKNSKESYEIDIKDQILKIGKKITKGKRKQKNDQEQEKFDCSICLEQIKDSGQIVGCKHTYCFQCIDVWAKKQQTCPECRKQFNQINRVQKQRNCKMKSYFYENEISDNSASSEPMENIFNWIPPTNLLDTQVETRTSNLFYQYTSFYSNTLAYLFASDSD